MSRRVLTLTAVVVRRGVGIRETKQATSEGGVV